MGAASEDQPLDGRRVDGAPGDLALSLGKKKFPLSVSHPKKATRRTGLAFDDSAVPPYLDKK